VIRLMFERFRQLGSARQTHLSLAAEGVFFPRPSDGKRLTSFEWTPIRYRNVIGLLKNPFYAGAYVYGKSEKRIELVDGRARKSYGHGKPPEAWEVLIHDHHAAYLDWAEYERNQTLLATNAYGRVGGQKSGRGGRALLSGMLTCGRCGRGLAVAYTGTPPGRPTYRCDRPNLMLGLPRCLGFGGSRVDAVIATEILRVVEPMAIEAALEAERMHREGEAERRRVADLDLQQAEYDASLAERRYAACDPENRLIAAQLEKHWEAALRRVEACRSRLAAVEAPDPAAPMPNFEGLATDLAAAWSAPGVTTRSRQHLIRALISDIIADVDDATREVVLTIHWRGGQHSQLRVRKPKTGEHGCQTPEQALAVMERMATRFSDGDIAATLNRMGLRTGQDKTWTAHRVASIRRVRGIHAYRSAEKDGYWLTMREAALRLGVTSHVVRRMIQGGTLPAEQVVPGAPWQIQAVNLENDRIVEAVKRNGRPCHTKGTNQLSMFPDT
jgi:excisionase family DNA binding protein